MISETRHSLCIAGVEHISIEQAEDILELMKTELSKEIDSNSSALLRKLLICTSETKYIRALPNDEARMDWSQTALATIRALNYSFRDLLEDRTNDLGDKVLFIDLSRGKKQPLELCPSESPRARNCCRFLFAHRCATRGHTFGKLVRKRFCAILPVWLGIYWSAHSTCISQAKSSRIFSKECSSTWLSPILSTELRSSKSLKSRPV